MGQVTCYNTLECVGQPIDCGDWIKSYGYKSSYSPSTNTDVINGDTNNCRFYSGGSFSSYEMGSFDDDYFPSSSFFYASGGFSGMGGDYSGDHLSVTGSGVASLANSYIDTDSFIECSGAMSCYNSTIDALTGVVQSNINYYGFGSKSMENIYINGGDYVDIILAGHRAGYNAKIICRQNSICNIVCYGIGCFGTYFICDSSTSTCNIDVTNAASGIEYEPLEDLNDALPYIPIEEKDWDINIIEQGLLFDAHCNLGISTTVDDFGAASSSPITSTNGGSVCCRAQESCNNYDISLTNGGNIICDGKLSCVSAKLNLGNSITSNVSCGGEESCVRSTISNNPIDGIVYCGGEYSCKSATISNINTLYATGLLALANTTVKSVENVYVTGFHDTGFWVNTFISDGVGTMNIYMTGYSNNLQVNINCERDDFCNIYCHTQFSCGQVTVNSVCTNYIVTCDDLAGWNCPTINDDKSNCPGYAAINSAKTYSGAKSYCLSNFGTSLATITSERDERTLIDAKNNAGFPSYSGTWIGLTDSIIENTFSWDDGSGDAINYYTNWATNEPNGGNNNDCIVMTANGEWKDVLCAKTKRFACNNPDYIFVKNPKLNFSDASKYCRDVYGRNLAYINSEDSNNIGYNLMINNNENEAWIGIKGTYVNAFGGFWLMLWVDGDGNGDTGSTYTKWDNNEPDLDNTNGKKCGKFDSINNVITKSWQIDNCDIEKAFLCDKTPY